MLDPTAAWRAAGSGASVVVDLLHLAHRRRAVGVAYTDPAPERVLLPSASELRHYPRGRDGDDTFRRPSIDQ
jgi:hypothetical protein